MNFDWITLPIIDRRDVPSSAALMKSPFAGMKVSSEPAKMPGSASGSVMAAKSRHPARVEIGRGLDQPPVDFSSEDIQRQDHEWQEVVGDARDHGGTRGQQPPVLAHQPDVAQALDHPAGVGQDQLPRHRPQGATDVKNGRMISSRIRFL